MLEPRWARNPPPHTRFHEHDLEQEHGQHADVVGAVALEEEPPEADQPGVAVGEDPVQPHQAAEVGHRRHAAEMEREATCVISHEGDGEGGHVHHHHVAGVLGPGEARHQHGEADLHEQDQVAGHEQPGEVDRHPEVPGFVGQLVDPHLRHRDVLHGGVPAGGADEVGHAPGVEAGRVGVVVAHEGPHRHHHQEREEAEDEETFPSGHGHPLVPPRPSPWAAAVAPVAAVNQWPVCVGPGSGM
jgi:hypothetical protein